MEQTPHVHAAASKGRPLRVLQLTDLHEWPSNNPEFQKQGDLGFKLAEYGYQVDKNDVLTAALLDRLKPDLVILTGDIIDSRPLIGQDSDSWREPFGKVIQPMIDRSVPWTFVPGNHDHDGLEAPFERDELTKIFDLPMCVAKGSKQFNHTFTIGPSVEFDEATSVRIWCFDSGINDEVTRYTTIGSDTVQAFKELAKTLPKTHLPSLAYLHIPLPEYAGLKPVSGVNGLFDAALASGKVPRPWRWMPWLIRGLGKDRIVGASTLDSGLFDEMVDSSVAAVFCGHDHFSDSCFKHKTGVYLCYGRCGGYTPPSDWEGAAGGLPFGRGARVVDVGVNLETWVETEKGEEPKSRLILDERDDTGNRQLQADSL